MGTTRDDGSQHAMWVATADLPQGGGHPFYERLNEVVGQLWVRSEPTQCPHIGSGEGTLHSPSNPWPPVARGRRSRCQLGSVARTTASVPPQLVLQWPQRIHQLPVGRHRGRMSWTLAWSPAKRTDSGLTDVGR